MDGAPEPLRGGLLRRGLALLVDLIVLQVLLQVLTIPAFPLSGGVLVDTNALFTSCQTTTRTPDGVHLPSDFAPTEAALCTKSLFGWTTARLFVASHRDPGGSATVTRSYPVDGKGRATRTFDIGGLQALALVILRWVLDRRGWRSLGRRWLSLTLAPRRLDGDLDRRTAVDRRYVLFGLPVAINATVLILSQLYDVLGGPAQAEVLSTVTFLGNLPLTVAAIAAAGAVARGRDAYYDEGAGTAVARLVDGSVQVASDRPASLLPIRLRRTGRTLGVHAARRQAPWVASGLAALLCAVFLAELLVPAPGPLQAGVGGGTLVRFGGISRELVGFIGQWYRLVAAIFVHVNAAHLLANATVLVAAGWFLEGVLGRGWFLAAFLLGGLVASLASITVNAPSLVSVGASGAVTAVLAAGYVASLRLVDDARRLWLRAFCIACLAAALQATGKFAWGTIDRADHVGGALGGAVIGAVVVALWGVGRDRPPLQRPALAAALVLPVALVASVPWTGFGDVSVAVLMVPPGQLPRTDQEWAARSTELVRLYPADPRTHLARAIAVTDKDEREREIALAVAAQRRLTPDAGWALERKDLLIVGSARQEARDWPTALDLFTRSIAANPSPDPDALGKRSEVEASLGSLDAALDDLRALAGLRPKDAVLQIRIADTLFMKNEPAQAVTSLDEALDLAPDHPLALRQRGWIGFFARRGDAAVQDLERAASLAPKDAYAALWLDIVATRSGFDDRMRGLVQTLDRNAWPWPVVRLFLGEVDLDGVRAAAADPDPVTAEGQRCEAEFYYGEWRLTRHDEAGALPHLRAAAATCPNTFYEWSAVRSELAGNAGLHP